MADHILPRERAFIALCVVSAFLVRFLMMPHDGVINGDGAYYASLGAKVASGDISGGISGYWSPFYSVLVGLASLFFSDLEFAGRFVSVVAGTLLIVPAYLLIREFYGRVPADLGIVLLVVHPFLIQSSTWVMTEAVFTLIFTTAILVGWYGLRNGKWQTFLWTGVLWGIAYLTKPESIGFIALVSVLVLCARYFQPKISLRRYLLGYLLILAGFLVLCVPYVVFLYQKTGQLTISQKIVVNLPAADYEEGLLGIPDNGTVTMQDRIWGDVYETQTQSRTQVNTSSDPPSSLSWSELKMDLAILSSRALTLLRKQFKDYFPAILPYPFILVAIIGFFYRPWTRLRVARELYLLSFVISLLIGYSASAIEFRYIFPLTPIMIAWVAHGIMEFDDWLSKSLSNLLRTKTIIKPGYMHAAVVVFFAILLFPALLRIHENVDATVPYEEKRAGLWLKDRISSEQRVVMAPNILVAYYAGADHLFLPRAEISSIVEYARRKNAGYLVFSERRLRFNPAAFPSDDLDLTPQMRLVYKDDEIPDRRLRIYELLD